MSERYCLVGDRLYCDGEEVTEILPNKLITFDIFDARMPEPFSPMSLFDVSLPWGHLRPGGQLPSNPPIDIILNGSQTNLRPGKCQYRPTGNKRARRRRKG